MGYLTRPSENQTKPSQNQNVEKMSLENYPLLPYMLRALRKQAASGSEKGTYPGGEKYQYCR